MEALLATRESQLELYRARILQVVPGMPQGEVQEWCETFFTIGVSLGEVDTHLREVAQRRRERAQFEAGLAAAGYEVHEIEGRGDCLFGAVAHQVYGQEALHPLVRASCVAFLRALHARDAGASKADLEPYFESMARARTWGDDTCARALSDIYQRPLRVWMAHSARDFAPQLHPDFPGAAAREGEPVMELANFNGVTHFNSLVTPATLSARVDPARAGELEALALQRLAASAAAAAEGAAGAAGAAAAEGREGLSAGGAEAPRPQLALEGLEGQAGPAGGAAASGGGGLLASPASGLLAEQGATLSQQVQRSLMKSLSRAQRCQERREGLHGCSRSEGGGSGSGAGEAGRAAAGGSASEGGRAPSQQYTFPA